MEDLSIPDLIPPSLISWNTKNAYNYADNIADYEDLEDLGKAITQARIGLFKLNEKINEYERKEVIAKSNYERQLRRFYLESTAKTEAQKKARAELACEFLENDLLQIKQIKAEIIRYTGLLKSELETLNTVSNNLRQQMKMI